MIIYKKFIKNIPEKILKIIVIKVKNKKRKIRTKKNFFKNNKLTELKNFLKLKRGRLVEAYFDRSILKYITLHKMKVVARFYNSEIDFW